MKWSSGIISGILTGIITLLILFIIWFIINFGNKKDITLNDILPTREFTLKELSSELRLISKSINKAGKLSKTIFHATRHHKTRANNDIVMIQKLDHLRQNLGVVVEVGIHRNQDLAG